MSTEQQSKDLGSPLMAIKNELLLGAVVRGELPTVRRLLDRHRADINTKNSNDIGCLQLAILNEHTKLAEFLIQKGVDIHMTDPDGYTALHDAALVENVVLVHKLVAKGLSPLLTSKLGELAIDVAGSLQMEKLLCEEMFQFGEVELARQYYAYLGLGREEKFGSLISRGAHPPPPPRKHQGGATGNKSHTHASSPKSSPKITPKITPKSSPKITSKSKIQKPAVTQSDCQVSRNSFTHASRIHPSANSADSSEQQPPPPLPGSEAAEFGPLPNYRLGFTGNHRNADGAVVTPYKANKEASLLAINQSFVGRLAVISEESSSGSSDSNSPPTQRQQSKSKSNRDLTHPPNCEFHPKQQRGNLSPKQARESAAIKALQQHNNFQLQIGLSLQSEQFSTLDEGIFAADKYQLDSTTESSSSSRSTSLSPSSSKLSTASSPGLVSRRNRTTIQPDWFLTEQRQQQQQQQHPPHSNQPISSRRSQRSRRTLNKTVSFSDLPMTRSKPMFVGQSRNQSSNNAASANPSTDNKKTAATTTTTTAATGSTLTHSLSFSTTNILDRYISNYNPHRTKGQEESEAVDSMFDAGIRALRLKPRKSSILSPMRRHSSEGGLQRRRSVTFQPEVLLQEIVTDGDVKAVSEILESGMIADVNKMSPSGLTALHQSAIDGNLECAKTLVEKGADVNCTDCERWTPLHAAVVNGSIEFVRFLLASGAKPILKNDSGETAYDMAKNGPIRKMLLHAMNGRSPDADEFSDGEYSGEEEEEEYSHAESESDDDLEGALFDSSMGEKTSLKERLGLTHTSALDNLQSNSVTPSPDLDNVFSGSQVYPKREHELTDSTSSYGSLLELDDRIKDLDKNNVSGVGNSSTKIFNTESDTDKISESGISTMEGSSDCSHRSRMLSSEDEAITLDSDLDSNSLDYEFQEACLYCDVDRVLKLLKFKPEIDINRVNKTSGITALHHSVLEENFALVQLLVKDFDADLHMQDIDGWTPLHAASAVGSIQIAQFLLDSGAKPSSLNLSCEFPVDVAEDEAMEKLLKNAMLGHSTEKGLKR